MDKNVVFNWYRSHNAVHTDHSFTGCGKYFFFFLADHIIAITISCIKPELTRQYPEGELQYRTLVKTGGSGCPQPLATPLPLATSAGGKQPGNFLNHKQQLIMHKLANVWLRERTFSASEVELDLEGCAGSALCHPQVEWHHSHSENIYITLNLEKIYMALTLRIFASLSHSENIKIT